LFFLLNQHYLQHYRKYFVTGLSQKRMAELFECSTDNISLHLKNIYNDGELDETTTTEDFSVVRQEGNRQVKRKIIFYSLEAIIAVGYRVNSTRGSQFRVWATEKLKNYILKGFAIDGNIFFLCSNHYFSYI